MDDRPLDWPDPDWANPQPSDAPSPEQVHALGEIRALSLMLPDWLAAAVMGPLQSRRWRELAIVLAEKLRVLAEQDVDPITIYTPAKITILSHAGIVDVDGKLCARCGLPLVHELHTAGRHRLDSGNR